MFDEFIQSFVNLQQPWWVYALVFLIPLCVLLSLREACCWFFKLNKLVNRLERVEAAIVRAAQTEPVARTNAVEAPAPVVAPPPRKGPSEL